MRSTSGFAAIAALISLIAADDAPVAENTNMGMTFAATLPTSSNVTGSVIGAGAPDGRGSNIQIALYNLPQGSTLSYGITASKVTGGDCSTGGGLLDPFSGVSGADCTQNNQAECQIGDLSGKHGSVILQTGAAGTGFFTDNFVDLYISTDSSSKAFFGNKAIIIMDQTGTPLTCANFVNQQRLSANGASNGTETASASSGIATMTSGSASQASQSASSTESDNGAVRTAAAGFGAAAGAVAFFWL